MPETFNQTIQYEYLVLSGGGAKGILYSGVLESLHTNNVFDNIKAIAGSSAGAIAATVAACGSTPEEISKLFQETNLSALTGKGLILRDGKPLLELLQNTISQNIDNYILNHDIDAIVINRRKEISSNKLSIQKDNKLTKAEKVAKIQYLDKHEDLLKEYNPPLTDLKIRLKSESPIYFRDLSLLNAINPNKFKELAITASDRENGQLTYFDNTTRDIEIAIACKTSASFPILFAPVKINDTEYLDGGYINNIPVAKFHQQNVHESQNQIFLKKKEIDILPEEKKALQLAGKKGRILAFAFDNNPNGTINTAIYGAREKITQDNAITRFLYDVILRNLFKMHKNFKYHKEFEKILQDVRHNRLDTVALDHRDVGTIDFKKAKKDAKYYHIRGQIQTDRHLTNLDIVNNDSSLIYREFCLGLYDSIKNPTPKQKIGDIFVKNSAEKKEILLSFCDKKKWNNREEAVLHELVTVCAIDRKSNNFKLDTNSMNKLIDNLNSKTTPNLVKQKFMQTLGVSFDNDQHLAVDDSMPFNNQIKKFEENLIKFKFDKKDFEKFLVNNKYIDERNNYISRPDKLNFLPNLKKEIYAVINSINTNNSNSLNLIVNQKINNKKVQKTIIKY